MLVALDPGEDLPALENVLDFQMGHEYDRAQDKMGRFDLNDELRLAIAPINDKRLSPLGK